MFQFGHMIYKTAKSFFSLFGITELGASDKEITQPLSNAEIAFNSFVSSYESCKKISSDSCLCDEFEVSILPEGYLIKLEKLSNEEKTRIGLYSNKPTAEKVTVIDGDNICFYNYDELTKAFSQINPNEIVLDSKSRYPYKINDKVQLFKLDNKNTCFVSGTYESKLFDEITKLQQKCDLKARGISTIRIGMLDLSDYSEDYPYESFVQTKNDEASKIIEDLRTFLLNNVGEVTRITGTIGTTQTRLERRQNTFKDAYNNFDKNNNGFINDDIYFISIRGLSLQSKNSNIKKDYISIHYLDGSEQSKIIAEKISSSLNELNGKLIFKDKELKISEADEQYRFDFEIISEENSKQNPGPVFLACTQSYSDFVACKENTFIPAVFIDIVEVDGSGHYMFEAHHASIARKVYEGIKDYLG